MGIKDYLKYIQQEFPNAKSRVYDYVYMDCNYMCHYLIYRCKSDLDLYIKIFNYWDLFSNTIGINKELHLVFDGEYANEFESSPKYQTHILRAKAKPNSDIYESQSIFPKSQILKTFREYLVEVIERYKKINRKGFKIIINSDEISGEADIKILDTIANHDQNNICVCSKDSDMILISHILSVKKSICIDAMLNFRPIKFVKIEMFSKYGLDYALIVMLLGNDYLPKISNVKYDTLVCVYDKYAKSNNPIISEGKINYSNLINFISHVIANSNKKIKFKTNCIDLKRFGIYFNNLQWCLGYYKVISNSNKYVQETLQTNAIKLKHSINIYNFINYNCDC